MTARSETNVFGFSIKLIICLLSFNSTTPKSSGLSTFLTQIVASESKSNSLLHELMCLHKQL